MLPESVLIHQAEIVTSKTKLLYVHHYKKGHDDNEQTSKMITWHDNLHMIGTKNRDTLDLIDGFPIQLKYIPKFEDCRRLSP